ncbi:hypothetical protein QQ045_025947 [Rhodiola kirilowii]
MACSAVPLVHLAITEANGKTSSAYLIKGMYETMGLRSGLLSIVAYYVNRDSNLDLLNEATYGVLVQRVMVEMLRNVLTSLSGDHGEISGTGKECKDTGDRNTKFFHARASRRKKVNKIDRLKNDVGEWLTDEGEPVSELEIKEVVFEKGPTKAPGPDGFLAIFYQRYWHILRGTVISKVSKFFTDGKLEEGLNDIMIVIIPKCKRPKRMEEYMPISLCNVFVRIVTKILANRLKSMLHVVVSEAQSAFVPCRMILDNILLAHEVLHYIKTSIFFLKAIIHNARRLKSILEEYESISGEKVNYEKSKIMFSRNMHADIRIEVVQILGVTQTDTHTKYLGLPVMFIHNRTEMFEFLIEYTWKRVIGWKEAKLSSAGKEIMIKAIMQSIPQYAMMCYKLPESICKRLTRIICKFWWCSEAEGRGIHWPSKEKLCKAKEVGGMNFRDLAMFNDALLAKKIWRILINPSAMVSKVLKARYFKGGDPFVGNFRVLGPGITFQHVRGAYPNNVRGFEE